jgi:hypothetical protein
LKHVVLQFNGIQQNLQLISWIFVFSINNKNNTTFFNCSISYIDNFAAL